MGGRFRPRRFLGGPVGKAAASERAIALVGQSGCFAVVRHTEGQAIGVCIVRPGHDEEAELTYMFERGVWGQGLASEAASRIVAFAFDDLGAERVIAVTQATNLASMRLLTRIGLRPIREFDEFGERQVMFQLSAP